VIKYSENWRNELVLPNSGINRLIIAEMIEQITGNCPGTEVLGLDNTETSNFRAFARFLGLELGHRLSMISVVMLYAEREKGYRVTRSLRGLSLERVHELGLVAKARRKFGDELLMQVEKNSNERFGPDFTLALRKQLHGFSDTEPDRRDARRILHAVETCISLCLDPNIPFTPSETEAQKAKQEMIARNEEREVRRIRKKFCISCGKKATIGPGNVGVCSECKILDKSIRQNKYCNGCGKEHGLSVGHYQTFCADCSRQRSNQINGIWEHEKGLD